MEIKIVIVDDNRAEANSVIQRLNNYLSNMGIESPERLIPDVALDFDTFRAEALSTLQSADVVVTDYYLTNDFGGEEIVRWVNSLEKFSIVLSDAEPSERDTMLKDCEYFIWWYQKRREESYRVIADGLRKCLQRGGISRDYFPKIGVWEALSALKHRIAHLFLSMDIDLQGVGVLRKQVAEGVIQNAVNTPEAYLRDVLNNKEKAYYRQRLADLQFLVAKVSIGGEEPFLECDGEPSGGPVMPTLSESNLPDDKAIVNLILEEKRNNDSVVPLWNTLIALSGLKSEDKDKPFANIDPDTKSSIFIFMCLMDCKVDKNNINKQDVSDVMDYFDKIKNGKGWTVEGANPSPIRSFNNWFCALVDCLEKLREVIKPD